MTPRRLAFTLALGFAIGCIPLVGVTTGICAVVALILKLNMPAIQAANWIAMPLQLALLYPFLRLGQWIFRSQALAFDRNHIVAAIAAAPWHSLIQMSTVLVHAVLAWMITAGPAMIFLTALLTPVLSVFAKFRDSEAE